MLIRQSVLPLIVLLLTTTMGQPAEPSAKQPSAEQAWKELPTYEYGQDMGPLLAIDRVVIQAMASAESRARCAARLADVLADERTTLAARQYICLQLRQIGTADQVPLLARLLVRPETSEMARQALASIPGPEAADALRQSLQVLEGDSQVGVINALAARQDAPSVPMLQNLAEGQDQQVAAAALRALGTIGGPQAGRFLRERAAAADLPTPAQLAVALLRCAESYRGSGNAAAARDIYEQLSQRGQASGIRRAALHGLLQLEGDQAAETIIQWLASDQPAQQQIAASHLASLPEAQLDQLLKGLAKLPDAAKMAVLELAASRRGSEILPTVLPLVDSDQPELKRAAVRCLGLAGDASVIPTLLKMLAEDDAVSAAAKNALLDLPRDTTTAALLDALQNRPQLRGPVIDVLVELKCYKAIDPLIEIARRPDPAQYAPALEGLRGIADPDKHDIPRLVQLLLSTEPGKHRDEVEKTILIVTDKLPAGADRAQLVLDTIEQVSQAESPKYLPLLGRLGGDRALAIIQSARRSADQEVREAAIRAMCNWPNDRVADQLLELATGAQQAAHRRWALRAYVRVVTRSSDRPPERTLAMLQQAMKLASHEEDRHLVLQRAATVRTMPAVNWIAQYLDDQQLAQTACEALVQLAHHRFLRHPNMEQFKPILEKVGRIAQDPAVAERARRYRLGL